MQHSHTPDKVIGILTMVLAGGCSVIFGGMAMVGGALLGGAAAPIAAEEGGAEAAAVAGMAGGLVAVIGFAMLAYGVLSFAYGFGMTKGLRWAFMTGAIVNGIMSVLDIFGANWLFLPINIALCVYCAMRVAGKTGPPVM